MKYTGISYEIIYLSSPSFIDPLHNASHQLNGRECQSGQDEENV